MRKQGVASKTTLLRALLTVYEFVTAFDRIDRAMVESLEHEWNTHIRQFAREREWRE